MKRPHELLSSFDRSWKQFSDAWKKARANATEKSVHGVRVSTRRLIATLELTRALSRYDEISKLQKRFTKLLKALGPLRDIQVRLQTVGQMRNNGVILEFKQHLERRESRKIVEVGKELKRGTKRRLATAVKDVRSEFERLHEQRGEDRIHGAVERLLKSRRNEFLQTRKRFKPADAETLHEMRIALKKLRYTLEAAEPVLGKSAKDRARDMQPFQQLLGDTRDVELLRDELEKWSAKRGKKVAIVPALELLEEKRRILMEKIIESCSALEEIFPVETMKPAVETTRAVEPQSTTSVKVRSVAAGS